MTDIKELIKLYSAKSATGRLMYNKLRAILEKRILKKYCDEEYIMLTYKKRFGHDINLNNPTTYTEKLQWLKLFYRNEKMPICTDKYEVRQYLTDLGYKHLLNDFIGVYDNANDINFDDLPNAFVIKSTHGCNSNILCKSKDELNWNMTKRIINSWLKLNVNSFGRESNYKNIKPRIILEKFIEYQPLIDYKFMCFNGEPKYLQINNDFNGVHYVDFYSINWTRVDFTYERYIKSSHVLPKPLQFQEMKKLAREISAPFPYVRVDFYNPPNRIIFGELTFFPGGGLLPLVPKKNKYDELLGSQLVLPEANNNLDLYNKYLEK